MSPEAFARAYARAERAPAKPCCGHAQEVVDTWSEANGVRLADLFCGDCAHTWCRSIPELGGEP